MRSRHHRASLRAIAAVAAASLAIAACSSDDNASDDDASGDSTPVTDATEAPSTEPATEEPPATDPPETETPTTEAVSDAPAITEDRSYYILPPGNYGGLPKTDESTDQLALYDGLTPLRDEVTDEDIENLFLPAGLRADRRDHRRTDGPAGNDGALRRVRHRAHHGRDARGHGIRCGVGHRTGPRTPLRTRARARPCRRCGRTGDRRVRAGDEWADVHPERGDRATRDRPDPGHPRRIRRRG